MLKGKVALITGSTSGIGLGIAQTMAGEGATIVLNGFGDAKEIEGIRQSIEKDYGVKCVYNGADMTKPAEIQKMCADTIAQIGSLDILVNNAGIQFVSPIQDFPDEKWDMILSTNLSAAFHTIKATVQSMRGKKWGRIINIASAHGLVASEFKSAYVAAKHGIVGLTKTVALETAKDGITCNSICPGYVHTPLVDKQIADQAKAHNMSPDEVVEKVILEPQPTKKFIDISEVADLALFLCTDGAKSITGTALSIDGGWTAH
jgi:3-hydroxybutyrate dehydrogenase